MDEKGADAKIYWRMLPGRAWNVRIARRLATHILLLSGFFAGSKSSCKSGNNSLQRNQQP
jgi:hypothetical protein